MPEGEEEIVLDVDKDHGGVQVVESGADWTRGKVKTEADVYNGAAYVIEVLDCNYIAQEVFCRCQPQVIAGYGVVMWQGVSASEVYAAALMMHVPRRLWPGLIEDVQTMALAAADYQTKKGKKT